MTSNSPAQTERFAADIAGNLTGGECIALHGDLGAGKTRFVRGLLAGLHGDPSTVCSPTYVLLNVYDTGRLRVYHLDAYRTGGSDDLEAIGFSELLEQSGVIVVEWAERIADLLPPATLHVHLQTTGPSTREITSGHHPLSSTSA